MSGPGEPKEEGIEGLPSHTVEKAEGVKESEKEKDAVEQNEEAKKEEGEKTPEFKPKGILKKPGQESSRAAPNPIQIDAPPEDDNKGPRKIYRTQTGWIKKEDLPEELQENFVERKPHGDAKSSLKPKNLSSLKNTPPSSPQTTSSSTSSSASTSTSAPSSASSSPSSSGSNLKMVSKSPTTSKAKVLSKKSHSHNDISKASLSGSEQDLKIPKKKDIGSPSPALKKERPHTENKEKCTVS